MFDIGWQELFIVAILALIVVGPKDLPRAIRNITIWIRKAKLMTREFQAGVTEMVREAELEDLKDSVGNPHDFKQSVINAVDPTGELAKGMTLTEADLKADKAGKADDKEAPMTIGEAIDAGIVKPDAIADTSEVENIGMAVKRKPVTSVKPKPKAKPKPKPKSKPKPSPKPRPKSISAKETKA